ncbi:MULTISPECIES: MotA/TolQ/ExbB proton channel family protein [unclassified Sphingomonas]|uniref:motility protein A n=1 Tax=unclassified Sphingomonas TaxID=196159 RepID=UPI00226A067B|nr:MULTISPECIES: MotA/TolQ/ExbB proton channel family protein [unclassified Sphingomonas]
MIAQLFDPLALAIVGGGTAVATMLRTPSRDLGRALRALRTLGRKPFSAEPLLDQITAQARIAKRHGVVALDRVVNADPDIAAAVALIVDGASASDVEALLQHRRRARIERHVAAADVWSGAAEAAPAMGMVGTLVGLATMFATMNDPRAIGAAMAIALLATLYGALFANLLLMPVCNRLRAAGRVEAFERTRIEAPLVALALRETPREAIRRPWQSVA